MSQNDYLTDIVRKVVEPVMVQLVGVLTIFRPVIWRSIAYAFFLCVTYLLHSPFRTSNVSRTDSYAKVNKVVQTWCVLVLSCFHIAPKLFEDQKAEKCDGGETVATLFFPIFFMSTLFFLFLHKEKRKLKMGVTYGSSLSYVLLNSIVLALFATVHYTYIYRSDLFSKSKTGPFRYFLKVVSVPQVHDTPFKAILKLFSMCLLFTGLDYLYKRWHGFDPTRGILWSDLYDIEKAHIFDEEGSSTTDWRTLVPKPVMYRKEEEAPDGDAVVEGEYPENNSFVAGPPPTKKIIRGSRSTVFDFSIDGEADEIAEGKHPINRPAMVPWWSTFVFITAWQTFAANVLGFLSFDVRLMQPRAFPKIFNLHFVSKVAPDQAVKSKEEKDIDVWFDWIADVGDGFNSTYDMARLLAQPSIKLSTDRNVIPPSPTTELDKMARSVNPEERPTLRRYTSMTMEEKTSTELDLPRGSFVLIGGDLAYPSPCDETYSTRLFGPYSDALRGNYSLRRLFHLNQKDIVEPDPEDSDKAHITLLDAQSVANIVQGKNSLRQNANTVEEALRTVPLLFAIPGNHDWFDGLSTYSKYIVEKTWMGGWLMPQKSSYFLLRLPLNWFIICCDTGNTKDIDATQKNYFLGLIDSEMDEESCVILTCHEPGWLADAMELGEHSIQPEIDCLVRVLGTRVRVRIAGDIHNYSRHEPKDTASEAATLLVSGGGGAFLHGARGDKIISQGTEYVRASAFPRNNTYMSMASRLWGFRVVNWKFDLIIGHLCIGLIYSFLPLDAETLSKMGTTDSLTEFFSRSTADTMTLVYYLFFNAHFSLFPLLFYFMCFSLAGADRGASPLWRAAYGGSWTLVVVIVCCGMLVSIYNMVGYMQNKGALLSSAGRWESMLEQQTRTSLEQLIDHAIAGLGETSYLSGGIAKWASYFFNSYLLNIYSFVLKCMDPIETFAYLSLTLASGTMGEFKQEATRLQVLCYYAHLMMFFWVTVTPLVSFIIGIFLFISVRCFDYMYDGVYSAFQIENYKHFLRFRLDHRTRELHCFVIARETIPTVWELDPQHLAEYNSSSTLPPHLRRFPSRWKSILPSRRKNASYKPKLHDSFIVKPHRLPTKNT